MQIKKLKKNNRKFFYIYLKKYFEKKHIFLKSIKLFDWQYLSKNYYNFYILFFDKKINAVQGFIPTSRYDKNLKNDTIFLSVWSSKKVSTGSKLFFYFIKKLRSNLIAGLGGSKESFLFHKMLNFNCGHMSHFFLTSDLSPKKLISPSKFTNLKSKIIKKNFQEIKTEKHILQIDKEIFKYQHPLKSPKYLLNRYFKHPFYKYYIYEIRSKKKTLSIFVFRICKFKNKTAIRIIDYIGKSENFKNGKYLFRYMLKEKNSEYIDLYSYGIPKEILRKSSLEDVEKYKKIKLIIPNYFEPFQKRNINLSFAFKASRKILKKVRFFKGDSDLDRPNKLKNYARDDLKNR